MIITYYGLQFLKIQQGDLTLVYNPISAASEHGAASRFGADIALISANHPDFNGVENVSHGEKVPFAITGPGEYETKDVYVRGLETYTDYGGTRRLNTIYYVIMDGVCLCFLGALGVPQLGEKVREAIGEIDILFVPIGGKDVLSPAEAHKFSLTFAPHIIIPIHYGAASLSQFLKEAGEEKATPLEKLTLKKKDFEEKEGEVVVLSSM
ncbi:MAG: hypothetical protein A3D67_00235 [Candidatus Lloydbacteria bacterium RIFCSPHIGHO2_02_FULL_51_22]|uniref:Lactamase n=3 Tax=Candidatus Lloydiibacteriota TaxID=1817910 RepID=A0A1G2DD66_9BACT|nr:MAG: hypothetical protein A3D67_00235 [Candidatus Lloydbacteria bacterium RIFCSPHIGHO2_02_FULL_51_22]OGZ15716.1 MAG: hypothetical protein A3J08_02515 [Candidatus Lloydbacteria bacterium RIFCSPLOWO2_02_FULL_51_11]OGZ16165.1 MAG: hypothetical protein A3G11_03055 [Candidatus Lloydbacteria bacterium RIFCSPLOWO2_12_FULL_51_9]